MGEGEYNIVDKFVKFGGSGLWEASAFKDLVSLSLIPQSKNCHPIFVLNGLGTRHGLA